MEASNCVVVRGVQRSKFLCRVNALENRGHIIYLFLKVCIYCEVEKLFSLFLCVCDSQLVKYSIKCFWIKIIGYISRYVCALVVKLFIHRCVCKHCFAFNTSTVKKIEETNDTYTHIYVEFAMVYLIVVIARWTR